MRFTVDFRNVSDRSARGGLIVFMAAAATSIILTVVLYERIKAEVSWPMSWVVNRHQAILETTADLDRYAHNIIIFGSSEFESGVAPIQIEQCLAEQHLNRTIWNFAVRGASTLPSGALIRQYLDRLPPSALEKVDMILLQVPLVSLTKKAKLLGSRFSDALVRAIQADSSGWALVRKYLYDGFFPSFVLERYYYARVQPYNRDEGFSPFDIFRSSEFLDTVAWDPKLRGQTRYGGAEKMQSFERLSRYLHSVEGRKRSLDAWESRLGAGSLEFSEGPEFEGFISSLKMLIRTKRPVFVVTPPNSPDWGFAAREENVRNIIVSVEQRVGRESFGVWDIFNDRSYLSLDFIDGLHLGDEGVERLSRDLCAEIASASRKTGATE